MTCTPASLVAAAICYAQELSRDDLSAIQVYLACAWANAMDPDALAFITAAGITDSDQKAAVNKLVLDLKNNGTPSYWSREILIYPMVGGTALAHAVNLKNPGTNDMTFGAGITHTLFGGKGDGTATAFGDTGYTPAAPLTKDLSRVFMYLDTDATINGGFYFGAFSGAPAAWFRVSRDTSGTGPVIVGVNNLASEHPYATTSKIGAWVFQRQNATNQQVAYQTTALTTPGGAFASAALPASTMGLWCVNVNSAPNTNSNPGISGFSLGTPFANDTEWQEYRAIWEAFQTTLGRNRP